MKKIILFLAFMNILLSAKSQTVKDINGNLYTTITIGSQIWMSEDLKVTSFSDSTPIPYIPDRNDWFTNKTPAYCWLKNDTIAKNMALYNWYVVETQKLCPIGWHVPLNEEWTILENYLISNGYNYDGSFDENKIAKSLAADTIWAFSDVEGSPGSLDHSDFQNLSGFSALPGGYRDHVDVGGPYSAYWWTSTKEGREVAYYRKLQCNKNTLYNLIMGVGVGYSVRCIMDKNSTNVKSVRTENSFLYPNPATEKFYLTKSNFHNTSISIIDLQGKQIITKHVTSNEINISSLNKGIYVVKLFDSGQITINKLVKE